MNAINAKLFEEIDALVSQFDVDENSVRAAVRTSLAAADMNGGTQSIHEAMYEATGLPIEYARLWFSVNFENDRVAVYKYSDNKSKLRQLIRNEQHLEYMSNLHLK
jgi:hypothetical protein